MTSEHDNQDLDDELSAIEAGWGDEKTSTMSDRLRSAVPKEYAKPMLTAGAVLVIAIVGFGLVSVIKSESDAEGRVSGVETVIEDIPQDNPNQGAIYGEDSPEAIAIREEENRQFDTAADAGESSVADLTFFDAAKNVQAEAVSTNDNDVENSDFYQYTKAQQNVTANPNAWERPKPKSDRDILRVPYDFATLVDEARVDSSDWGTTIENMAASSKEVEYGSSSGDFGTSTNEAGLDSSSRTALNRTPRPEIEAEPVVASTLEEEPLADKPFYTIAPTEIHWIQLVSMCNTDEPGVIAEFITGPLNGRRLMGTCSVTPTKRILLEMNAIVWEKRAIAISSVALDPVSFQQSLQGKVDSHYFSRYVPFILANFAKGFAEALVSTTNVTLGNGTTVEQVNQLPDSNTQIKFAAGRTLEALLPTWEDKLDRKPTGTIPRHSVHALMFREPVDII